MIKCLQLGDSDIIARMPNKQRYLKRLVGEEIQRSSGEEQNLF